MSCEGKTAAEHKHCEAEKKLLEEPLTPGVSLGPYQSQRKKANSCLAPLDMVLLADLDPKITARAKTSERTKYLSKMGYSKYDTVYNQDICYEYDPTSCCASVTLKYKPPEPEVWKWDLAEQQLWEYLEQRGLSTEINDTKHVCVDAWEIARFQRESNQAHQIGVQHYFNRTDDKGKRIVEAPRRKTVTYEIYCDSEYQAVSNKINMQSTPKLPPQEVASMATILAYQKGVTGLMISLFMAFVYIY